MSGSFWRHVYAKVSATRPRQRDSLGSLTRLVVAARTVFPGSACRAARLLQPGDPSTLRRTIDRTESGCAHNSRDDALHLLNAAITPTSPVGAPSWAQCLDEIDANRATADARCPIPYGASRVFAETRGVNWQCRSRPQRTPVTLDKNASVVNCVTPSNRDAKVNPSRSVWRVPAAPDGAWFLAVRERRRWLETRRDCAIHSWRAIASPLAAPI